MSFIDQTKIHIKAGDGGKGCLSFYYNKPKGRRYPDGGDGGKGGNIIIRCNSDLWDLKDYKFNRSLKAKNGAHGKNNNKRGKDGKDLVVEVPPGTLVRDLESGSVIKDLTRDGEEVIVAKGGKGGRGNRFTKSNLLPPERGEEKELILELKLLAHAGLIGFPNAGKTTLINALSKTKGKVAGYPFTTLNPLLGVIWFKDKPIKIVDIPGLIEDSHKGKGLGDNFLKHIQRTHLLIYVLGLSEIDPLPWMAFKILRKELEKFDPELIKKDYIILANKIDLPEAKEKIKILSRKFKKEGILTISALKGTGIEMVKNKIVNYFRNRDV